MLSRPLGPVCPAPHQSQKPRSGTPRAGGSEQRSAELLTSPAERSDGGSREALTGRAERSDGGAAKGSGVDSRSKGEPRSGKSPRSWRPPLSSQERAKRVIGAKGGTRTPTVLLPPAPQAGASANSATFARRASRARPEEAADPKPNRHSSMRHPASRTLPPAATQSVRSARIGEIEAARRAGRMAATKADAASASTPAPSASGSQNDTP